MADAMVTVSAAAFTRDADLENLKKAQHSKKTGPRATLLLAYAAIGVIFGDIGTSPLYVYSSTFTDGINDVTDVFGVASLVFWTLTIVVICKYCLIVLQADDFDEGGTFALYSLICRHANISAGDQPPPTPADLQLEHYSSHQDIKGERKSYMGVKIRATLEKRRWAQIMLLCVTIFMTSLVLGDAVLTPAQSVLGAIYGLQVKEPQLSQGVIVGVSCAIVIIIFMAQRFGTSKLGASFAPIILLWFLFNVIVAIYNIANYYPAIFKCFSPQWAYLFFKHNRHKGWEMLAGVFLSVTGAEATFADLGHFSKASIRLAFFGIAYPALVLTYFGQAAYLTAHPDQVASTFYASIPFGDVFYWVFFTIATAAACVASQTMISAAFSLLRQSMSLGCFPRLTIIHTSKNVMGQIFIPEVNYLMMVLTVIVVAIFKTTTQLGNAYGVAVSGMMFGTTCLLVLVMFLVWNLNLFIVAAFFLFFGFVDMVYFSTNLNKVPHGGWFALAIAAGVGLFSHVWAYGNWTKRAHSSSRTNMLEDYLPKLDLAPSVSSAQPSEAEEAAESAEADPEAVAGQAKAVAEPVQPESPSSLQPHLPLTRCRGLTIYYHDNIQGMPQALVKNIARTSCLTETVVIMTVRQVAVSSVGDAERLLIVPTPLPGVLRCVARYGYQDRVKHGPAFITDLLSQASALWKKEDAVDLSLAHAVHIVTRPHLRVNRGFLRMFVVHQGYNNMVKYLARQPWEEWDIPENSLVEWHCQYHV